MREHEEPTLYVSGQEKITEHHLARLAYIYIRQSSPGQVANNKESALNQRLMAKRAVALGWRPDQVHIIKVSSLDKPRTTRQKPSNSTNLKN
jgi:hypothetical protein